MANYMLKERLLSSLKAYVNHENFKSKLSLSGQVALKYLAQGEYNLNYLLETNHGPYVLRVNTASQMNLKNQIAYEYQALRILSSSGVTPRPYYLDDRQEEIPYGLLVMEYLPGEPLHYNLDLPKAAETFAKIHSLRFTASEKDFLVKGIGPFSNIYREASGLLQKYFDFPQADSRVRNILEKVLLKAKEKKKEEEYLLKNPWSAVINTEVNSHNFIVNRKKGSCHLIDWEKPILGEPAQDLSMFLVATTTLWKSEIILSSQEEESFIRDYIQKIRIEMRKNEKLSSLPMETLRERISMFKFFNYLRAISWCAMAWTEYVQPGRELQNPDTFEKIKMYIEPTFIQRCFHSLGLAVS
jgi:aminoglycoside phosphotransferase (APT) family kinase protein